MAEQCGEYLNSGKRPGKPLESLQMQLSKQLWCVHMPQGRILCLLLYRLLFATVEVKITVV